MMQPILSVLGVEAIMIGVLALLFGVVWWRGREPGMAWLVVGFAVAALWYMVGSTVGNTGPDIVTWEERLWSAVIGFAVVSVAIGVMVYVGWPRGPARWWLPMIGLPAPVVIVALLGGVSLSHRVFHFAVLVAYLPPALLALRRAFDQPGDGHLVLAIALASLVVLPFAMTAADIPPEQLKYMAGVSRAAFGMVLLTVCLLRRHRALHIEVRRRRDAEAQLRDVNARLEAKVSERTAHLRDLISGLEFFNRGVSHDLRGPLGGMSNLASLAADDLARGDAEMARRALPLIARQCDASVELLSTMLELARIGDIPARREPVCMAELVRAAFDEVMLGVRGTRPDLRCAKMPLVLSDPRLLRPVFVNLIGNAVKFTRDVAAPRIDIEATVRGRDVSICVRDNGVGFDPELASQMFDPFVQGADAKRGGHGLGLSIVRRAVQALGGTVWAEGQPGGGAALHFRLPDALAVGQAMWSASEGVASAV